VVPREQQTRNSSANAPPVGSPTPFSHPLQLTRSYRPLLPSPPPPLYPPSLSPPSSSSPPQRQVLIRPASKVVIKFLQLMQKHGYIGEFEFVDDHRAGKIVVELNGRLNKCGVISPRYDIGHSEVTHSTAQHTAQHSTQLGWWSSMGVGTLWNHNG